MILRKEFYHEGNDFLLQDIGNSSKDDPESADKEVENLSNGMTRKMRRNGTESSNKKAPLSHSQFLSIEQ